MEEKEALADGDEPSVMLRFVLIVDGCCFRSVCHIVDERRFATSRDEQHSRDFIIRTHDFSFREV